MHAASGRVRRKTVSLFCIAKHSMKIANSFYSRFRNYLSTRNVPFEGMVLIPAGEFWMGGNNEKSVHSVYVDAFYMDKYEVTNAQYKQFIDANPLWRKNFIPRALHDGKYLYHWAGNNYPAGEANHPIRFVSWYAAMAYAQWKGKRLPTEAEWEKAARGGVSGMEYPWGNDYFCSPGLSTLPYFSDPRAVGKYPANGYGLHDMVGNVWEWCLDEYSHDFYKISPARRNPVSGAPSIRWHDTAGILWLKGLIDTAGILCDTAGILWLKMIRWLKRELLSRVFRGGWWSYTRDDILKMRANVPSRAFRGGGRNIYTRRVRVIDRGGASPEDTSCGIGFRCVRDVTP